MINFDDQKLLEKLQVYLGNCPDAIRFVKAFQDYCHNIDDIIDEKITDPEKILKVFLQACSIYSSAFYQRYAIQLHSVIMVITNSYADSVKMDHSGIAWKKKVSDVLRTAGNDMLILVVGIVAGWESMRDVSELIREYSYAEHHNELGEPI